MNGTSASECDGAYPSPQPIPDVPAGESVPSVIPSEVEPVSGQLVEEEAGEDEEQPFRRKPGPKPLVESHRMKEVLQFIEGRIPGGELGRLRFLRLTQFTAREKSYLVNHPCFKELYDAMIFDFFMHLEEPTREQLKLLEIVGKRVGLSKPATQVNVQVNNNSNAGKKEKNTTIKVVRE